MWQALKSIGKVLLKALPIAFTRNQRYDRDTQRILRRVLQPVSNAIDIGCHKGEVLDMMMRYAPQGHHYGFEPIPEFYAALKEKYKGSPCTILPIALSNTAGNATFNYVVSNPAYSGLKKRHYDRPDEQDTTITVETARLDNMLPEDYRVDLMKIDVEGAELQVLQGAQETLGRWKPVVVFEHGMGAADCYGTQPEQVFDLFAGCGLKVSLLQHWLKGKGALERDNFVRHFHEGTEYYFVAHP
jgi:FkbM family methyltransferase